MYAILEWGEGVGGTLLPSDSPLAPGSGRGRAESCYST